MRHLLIFLACCSLAFGVYVSPAEDTVHFVGHNQGWTEGATLVTNGTFTTDFTGWTEHTAVGVTIDTNTCKFTDAGGGGNFYIGQDIVNTVGKVYRLSYDVTANTGVAEGEFVLPATCLFGAKADLGITNRVTLKNCVINAKYVGLSSGAMVKNSFFYGGTWGCFSVGGNASLFNCIFYNQTEACIYNNALEGDLAVNNIFVTLAANDTAIYSAPTGGNVNAGSSNNLAWTSAGVALTTPFYSALTDKTHEIFLPNTIEADPQFVDPSTGDFRLKSNSPALKAGFKDFFGKSTNIGVNNEPRSRSDWVWR